MKLYRSWGRTFVASLAILFATSIASFAATGNSKAVQLVDNLYGGQNVAPIRDLIVEMDCTDSDEKTGQLMPSSKDKVYFKAPYKLRIDTIIQDPGGPLDQRQAIIIRDGVTAWHYLSTGQYPVKKRPDNPSPTSNLPFSIQKYPIDTTKSYEMGAVKTIEGVNAQEVIIKNPQDPKDVRSVCIDTKRLVPLRQDYTRTDGDKTTNVTVEYSDIRQLSDGRYFPFLIKIYNNGTLQKVRCYKGVSVNVGLDDAFFNPMGGIMR